MESSAPRERPKTEFRALLAVVLAFFSGPSRGEKWSRLRAERRAAGRPPARRLRTARLHVAVRGDGEGRCWCSGRPLRER
eukprot:13972541-Alexandrium_andersonii.AAC.1